MDATRQRRWRTARDGITIALAALTPLTLLVFGRLLTPSDGTATYPSAPPWSASGVVIADVAGGAGDLRRGDRVIAVGGMPVETWLTNPPAPSPRFGQILWYDVVRAGSADVQSVPVTLIHYPVGEVTLDHFAIIPLLALLLAVAGFVVLRRPEDRAARALFRTAVIMQFGGMAWPYSTQVIDVLTGRLWPLIVSDAATALFWGALLHFTLVFPRPRGPAVSHPRATAITAYALPGPVYAGFLALTLPGATGALERTGRLVTISVPSANTLAIVVAVLFISSYFTAKDALTRRRLAWVFAAFGFAAVAYIGLGRVPERLTGAPLVPWDWQALFFIPFPIALGVAVLRYRLFDVEVILRRSFVYGTLTTTLAVVYLGSVALLGRLFGTPLSLGPLVAGAVVVVLYFPLRAWLRGTVSRLIFGDRDDPYEVLRRLGQRLEATASADSVLSGLAETLVQALRLSYVSVELTGLDPLTASHGQPSGEPMTIPLTHRGEEVGRLVLDPGALREPFGADDQRLLDGLARQVGVTAHNLLLTGRLQRSLERVVTAREEERRRLRRDIHDGLGPLLASSAMRLELAHALVGSDPAAARGVLTDLAETQQLALADLRRLVEGLRPPVLDQLGLVGAVLQRADRFTAEQRLTVTVDAADDLEPLPAAAEVAAYHIVSEALTNVAKHAHARTAAVKLWRDGPQLLVEIRDDGAGLPDSYRTGMGLHSIRERATELGGEASAAREATGGTAVRARLPLQAHDPADESRSG
jgi:signal transduction histidine kinase